MKSLFPFYSGVPGAAQASVYHTHPRCRVAQGIALSNRIPGTGESRGECPFCFLLGQFQANRALRGYPSAGEGSGTPTGSGPEPAPPATLWRAYRT